MILLWRVTDAGAVDSTDIYHTTKIIESQVKLETAWISVTLSMKLSIFLDVIYR